MRVAILRLTDVRAEPRVTKAAEALAEAGHAVRVFALDGPDATDPPRLARWNLERVAAVGATSWRQPLKKMREMRERNRAYAKAVLAFQPDVVHAVDTDTLSTGQLIAELRGAPLVYEAAELYPDMLLSNRAAIPSPVLAYWRRIERRHIPKAASVITVGEALAAELRSRFSVEPVVVRNVPEVVPEDRLDRSRLRAELDLPVERFIVLYQGLLNRGRGLDVLLEAVSRVPQADLVVQGDGPGRRDFLDRVAKAALSSRVHSMGMMPMEELTMWASGADVGSCLIENLSLNNYLSAPNKLYQYLMAGIPILGSDFPEIGAVIREGDCGFAVDPSDTAAVAGALRQLISLGPEGRASMGARARHLAETKYNWDREKQKLLDVYDRLAARSTS